MIAELKLHISHLFGPRREKVFGIGLNKSGTKSLQSALVRLGLRGAPQAVFERHLDEFLAGKHEAFFADVEKYEAFQDIPFSLPRAYEVLFSRYPKARYVLTIRDSADDWIETVVRFHTRLFGYGGNLPTVSELSKASYVEPGWTLRVLTEGYGTPRNHDPYDRAWLRHVYEKHIVDATKFFDDRGGSLLVLKVGDADAHLQLMSFLGISGRLGAFPHKNRSFQ